MSVEAIQDSAATKKPSVRLWVQLAWLLTLVAAAGVLVECLLLLGIVSRALERVPASTAAAFRAAVLPDLGGQLPLTALFGLASLCGLLLGGGVSLILALGVAKRLASPLEEAASAAHALSGGKLETRVEVSPALSGELRRLLESFNEMAQRLQRLDATRRYTNAAIAHELRTPIAAMRGRLAGIRDGVFQPSPAELGKLLIPLETLVRLSDDLQAVMEAETSGFTLHYATLDLGVCLEELVAGLVMLGGRELNLECQSGVRVTGDAVRLRQAVTILIENAFQHTPSDRQVRLRLEACDNLAVISVGDAGQGVSEIECERIFEAFYRGDPARTRNSRSGSGLGLTVARSIIESHGGTIAAGRADLGGLEVTIRLRLTDDWRTNTATG